MKRVVLSLALAGVAVAASAQGIRDRMRSIASGSGTSVSRQQESILNLTLAEAAVRPVQSWVRVSARMDGLGTRAIARVEGPEAAAVQPGQRVRFFTLASRSQMHQAKVVSVVPGEGYATVAMDVAGELAHDGSPAIAEIIADRGEFLSVPNVALIEEEGRQVVYVQNAQGEYEARTVTSGIQGELYTEIRSGLVAGDRVVSIGSFFIDAQAKLRGSDDGGMAGMNHAAMPGMDHGSMPGM